MKTLALIAALWSALFGGSDMDHQFKRLLRVPHYDASGEEITAEDEYVKEWLIRNWLDNPGFEHFDGVTPENWNSTGTLTKNIIEFRNGTRCVELDASNTRTTYCDTIAIPTKRLGLSGGIFVKHNYNYPDSNATARVSAYLITGKYIDASFVSLDVFLQTKDITSADGYVEFSFRESNIHPDATHAYIQVITFGVFSLGYKYFFDDAHIGNYNPHFLYNYDDFATLNVEDYETFTFGSDYDITDSGGASLIKSMPYGADDPVEILTMANGNVETKQLRSPKDVITLTFRLFSHNQLLKLKQFHKTTRAESFIWVDEYGIETEVIWPGAFSPKFEKNPDISTITINLIPTEATVGY